MSIIFPAFFHHVPILFLEMSIGAPPRQDFAAPGMYFEGPIDPDVGSGVWGIQRRMGGMY